MPSWSFSLALLSGILTLGYISTGTAADVFDPKASRAGAEQALPKLHVHLLQRLKDFTLAEVSGELGSTLRTQTEAETKAATSVNNSHTPIEAKEFETIGKAKIPRREVISVGDLDSNGHDDFIVARPKVNKRAGSIRLYLMGDKKQFLFSRELVPGKWGFQGPELKPGDSFGYAVYKLPSNAETPSCILAVGAPGDSSSNVQSGAVYILNISPRGEVLWSSKISADTEPSLAKQHRDDEGFGSEIKAVGDLNGDGDFELAVKSLSGSTTMLFLDASATLKTALKIHEQNKVAEKEESSHSGDSLRAFRISSLSIRPGVSGTCFFNDSYCACGMKSPEKNSASCMDIVGTEEGTGRTLCKARDCEASYACTCDGKEMCKRVDVTKNIYSSDGLASNGNVYCSQKPTVMKTNIVQVGIPLPTPEVNPELSPFNSTHCRCSVKKDIQEAAECLDYLRVIPDVAVLCKSRKCLQRDDDYACDGIGNFYCSREFKETTAYFDDGVTDDPTIKFCHQDKHTVEVLSRLF